MPGSRDAGSRGAAPEWSNGLKQLYDAVVEEALPDSFLELLAQLDDSDATDGNRNGGGGGGAGQRL